MSSAAQGSIASRRGNLPIRLSSFEAIGAAIIIGHAPLVFYHLRALWQKEQYQYFPFVLGAVIWLGYQRWVAAPAVNRPSKILSALSQLLLAGSLLLLVGSILTRSGWLAFVSMNVGLAAVLVWASMFKKVGGLWPVWCLLWLVTPPPLRADDLLVQYLQSRSSLLSSRILDLLGVMHLMNGNVLQLPDKEFFVDEACSGIVSAMSIIACAAIYGVWLKRTILHTFLLAICGLCWAIITNLIRITLIAAAYDYNGFDLSTGIAHDILGLVLFCVAFLALFGTDHLLVFLLGPIDLAKAGGGVSTNLFVRGWNLFIAPGRASRKVEEQSDEPAQPTSPRRLPSAARIATIAIPFLLLGVVQFIWFPTANTEAAQASTDRALSIDEELMPPIVGNWRRESFEAVERERDSIWGLYSRTYIYRHVDNPQAVVSVSLDFPYFGGWHDLCICYRTSGWEVKERSREDAKSGDSGEEWGYVDAHLTDPTGAEATVLYGGFSIDGEPATPPTNLITRRAWSALRRRLLTHVSPQLMQVQLFAGGSFSRTPEYEDDVYRLFDEARRRFRDHLTAATPASTNQSLPMEDQAAGVDGAQGNAQPAT